MMNGGTSSGCSVDGEITLVEPNSLNLGSVDWQALEMKFNELNALRNAPRSGLNACRARKQQKEKVASAIESLLEMAQAACRRLLVEGNAKEAVEGGLKTLKLKEAYYSTGSLQLIPAYFHLARTNQYMDKFKAAEEFLSLAQWTILRHPECDVALKAELHQTYGLLYASDGRLDIALKQLAQATYYLTELNGAEHVLTSFGFFDLGNVFAAKANMDCAMSFYDRVKDIWYKHLTECFQCQPFDVKARPVQLLSPEQLGEENLQDALKMLKGIVGLQTERFTQVHPCTGKADLVLGLFNVWIADNSEAQECLGRALEIHKRVYGVSHPTVNAIKCYMSQFKYPIPEHTDHYLNPKTANEASEAEKAAAALKIQALHRGRNVRKKIKETKKETGEEPKIDLQPMTEDGAATRIQALQRGRQARKKTVKVPTEEKSKPTALANGKVQWSEDEAATKIQALQRGRQTRKKKVEKPEETAPAEETAKENKDAEPVEEDKAPEEEAPPPQDAPQAEEEGETNPPNETPAEEEGEAKAPSETPAEEEGETNPPNETPAEEEGKPADTTLNEPPPEEAPIPEEAAS
eukprot:TRINITY_DN2740_c0_g2_i1.p1 TRINITY_DN2740_c0_g2~~TRINITY_DN2740_c0_g2_i1.p1  ORF type:complete len:579 (+),score=135.28 TRINITY_DN2740_c0_g2_i1:43-1779(+)